MDGSNTTSNVTYWVDDSHWTYDIDIDILRKVYLSVYCLGIILGIPFNLWLLLTITTSSQLRSRMRNKILSLICCQHLLECGVLFTFVIDLYRRLSKFISCTEITAFYNIQLICDFISNWNVFLLIIFYVFDLFRLQPCRRLTSTAVTAATAVILLSPWVLSLVLTPSIMVFYHAQRPSFGNLSDIVTYLSCLQPTGDSYIAYKSLDTALPLVTSTVALAVGVALRQWLLTRGDSMATELISDEPQETDGIVPILAILAVTYICDFSAILAYFRAIIVYDSYENYIWWQVSEVLQNFRVVLLTAIFFLFKDIRERGKSWRPWLYFQTPPDLTISYKKDIAG
ncbi:hypothetical protein Btru_044447 [Bulinus truncatus]|nr:hypothetical protein Btru_044447 [Bulinus truncatus]